MKSAKIAIGLIVAVLAVTGCGSSDTRIQQTPEMRKAALLRQRLREVDVMLDKAAKHIEIWVEHECPVTSINRVDATAAADEARTILHNLQNEHPRNAEIDKRIRRVENQRAFLLKVHHDQP